jgi:hypothetical protein
MQQFTDEQVDFIAYVMAVYAHDESMRAFETVDPDLRAGRQSLSRQALEIHTRARQLVPLPAERGSHATSR